MERIPGEPGILNLNNYHVCRSSTNNGLLELDRTEDPTDVAFSDDGLTVFTSNDYPRSKWVINDYHE